MEFPGVYKTIAEEKGVSHLDIGEVVRFSDADGIHFESDQLVLLGKLAAEKVELLLN